MKGNNNLVRHLFCDFSVYTSCDPLNCVTGRQTGMQGSRASVIDQGNWVTDGGGCNPFIPKITNHLVTHI